MSFRSDFYLLTVQPEFDLNAPGIYEWRITGIGLYVGKALILKSRIRAYPNNVRRMIMGLHWHGNPDRDYRRIHKALRDAHDKRLEVTVSVLENCTKDERASREIYWIARKREEALAAGIMMFNAD